MTTSTRHACIAPRRAPHRSRWLNADAFVTFSLDADGKVREGRMEAISPLTDFSFDFQDLRLKPVEEEKPKS